MSNKSKASKVPLYKQVYAKLRERIESGSYAVNELMPNEVDLAAEFQVSRATMRDAMGMLVDRGFIRRAKTRGTTVISAKPVKSYVQRLDGLDEILTFAGNTLMRIDRVDTVVDPQEDDLEGVAPSTGEWLRVTGARRLRDEAKVSTWSCVYVDGKYSGIKPRLIGEVDAVYRFIEELYDVSVVTLRQKVTAVRLPAYAAGIIDLRAGMPALEVTAWLYDDRERLMEYSRSIHNPELFSIEVVSHRPDQR